MFPDTTARDSGGQDMLFPGKHSESGTDPSWILDLGKAKPQLHRRATPWLEGFSKILGGNDVTLGSRSYTKEEGVTHFYSCPFGTARSLRGQEPDSPRHCCAEVASLHCL